MLICIIMKPSKYVRQFRGYFVRLAWNCLACRLDYIAIQRRKTNHKKATENCSPSVKCSNVRLQALHTWIKFITTLGSTVRGKRRMLNKEIATKALPAVSSFPSKTYTANVARETCRRNKSGKWTKNKFALNLIVLGGNSSRLSKSWGVAVSYWRFPKFAGKL